MDFACATGCTFHFASWFNRQDGTISRFVLSSLRANIHETPVVLLINEQGEKEKGRDEWEFFWCSFSRGFGWRGTERRRAKRAEYVEHE